MVRVIHTADTHIGYRQYHSPARRQDFLTAFEQVIDDAIELDVDAVVHAGDLFHDKRPDLRDLQGTIHALTRLRDANIPFLGIVGNHERKRDAQWLDLLADLHLATRLGPAPTLIGNSAWYGLDYLPPSARAKDDVTFEPADEATSSIIVGHGIIEGLPYGDWDLESMLSAAAVEFDAVLLGDYHEHEITEIASIPVTYPGSTERASADETAPRGYNLIHIDDHSVDITHRSISGTRPFVYIDLTLHPTEGEGDVLDRLSEYDLSNAVVIVTIEGAGDPISPATIETHARDRGAIVARVHDRRDEPAGDEESIAVSFGDPDSAVRVALTEVTLSQAAAELDGVIRDRSIPDTRVRERTRALIEDLLEEDPDALDREADLETAQAEGDVTPTETDADTDGKVTVPTTAVDEETGETDVVDDEETAISTDGQASMEDYL